MVTMVTMPTRRGAAAMVGRAVHAGRTGHLAWRRQCRPRGNLTTRSPPAAPAITSARGRQRGGEDIASAGFGFSFDEQTRKIKTDLVGNSITEVSRRNLRRLIGSLPATRDRLHPERFNWTADNFGRCWRIHCCRRRRSIARTSTLLTRARHQFRLRRAEPPAASLATTWVLTTKTARSTR